MYTFHSKEEGEVMYYDWNKRREVPVLIGQLISGIIVNKDKNEIIFHTISEDEQEHSYIMLHEQDCCESVYIEDICGDFDQFVNHRIVMAEAVESEDRPKESDYDDSYTWTFYKFADDKGNYVTLRWYGTSNGYYSESVDFYEV